MGAGDNYLRYVGHGVGLELDELPVLAPESDSKLESGMTLAIEPKVFFPGIAEGLGSKICTGSPIPDSKSSHPIARM